MTFSFVRKTLYLSHNLRYIAKNGSNNYNFKLHTLMCLHCTITTIQRYIFLHVYVYGLHNCLKLYKTNEFFRILTFHFV